MTPRNANTQSGTTTQLTPDQWLTTLLQPDTHLTLAAYGYQRLKPTWGYDNRQLPELLVYHIIEHKLKATFAGTTQYLRPHTILLLPANTRHSFAHADASRPVTLHWFRLAVTKNTHDCALQIDQIIQPTNAAIRDTLERLHDEIQSPNHHHTLRLKAIFALLFSTVFNLSDASVHRPTTLTYTQRRQINQHLRQHTAQQLRPADLADALNLSADRFTRLFTQTYGMPPRRWLMRQRIHEATTYLNESPLNVSQIAEQLGYADVYQFSRQFKKVLGQSPSRYRQQHNPNNP